MLDLGQTIKARRTEMGMSLDALARALGEAPGQSYLSRIERGTAVMSPDLAKRLAEALRLPEALLLNAARHSTDAQVEEALQKLHVYIGEPAPKQVLLPILGTDGQRVGDARRMMLRPEDAFLINLTGRPNEPFVGEALVLTSRAPTDEIGVIAMVDGRLSAWTYRDQGGKVWIENGRKERKAAGYEIRGVISRVAVERVFTE